MTEKKVLVVEDRSGTRRMLAETLSDEGYVPVAVPTGEDALRLLRSESFDLVLTDLSLPGVDGMHVLAASRESDPLAPVILMTAYGTVENAVRAMKEGAYDFVTKPIDADRLLLLVRRAAERRSLEVRNRGYSFAVAAPVIVGKSEAIGRALAEKVAPSDAAVLLLGESGTGKELFARLIHARSARAGHPLVAVNCAAIPRDLVEAELFGSEKGAYTGADRRRIGKFELADGGTLFFDEIGELGSSIQSKLLRALEQKVVERIGGTRAIRVDARLVTATNRVLEAEVREGRFREDLFYRLNVFPIHLPPLRERKEDIPLLVDHFLGRFAAEMKREKARLAPDALDALDQYEWPGNVRELGNVLERAVILAEGATIPAGLVASRLRAHGSSAASPAPARSDLHEAVRETVRRVETDLIGRVLRDCGGNKSEAARRMNISYRSLWAKVKEYGLE
jgi:DNA-binding NtrC family response regulator